MPFWRNPIFRMEIKRFGRLRVMWRGLIILLIAGALGGLHYVYQTWLQNLLFNTLPWTEWNFRLWQVVYNALNPWRWISIFAVYYLMRAPMRLTEIEEFWVTRLRPRDILRGKLAVMYVFFLFLFNISLILSLAFRTVYQRYYPIPFSSNERWEYYWYCLFQNPAYYIYMLLAPAYASIILAAIMLSFKNTARAMAAAMLMYLVALPFAQDYLVSKSNDLTYRSLSLWRRALMEGMAWIPMNLRGSYFQMVMEYVPRSAALVVLMIPFGAWLYWRYEAIMLKNFEYRHF